MQVLLDEIWPYDSQNFNSVFKPSISPTTVFNSAAGPIDERLNAFPGASHSFVGPQVEVPQDANELPSLTLLI